MFLVWYLRYASVFFGAGTCARFIATIRGSLATYNEY